MSDADVRALSRKLADLERRMAGMERSSRLERASVAVDAQSGRSLSVAGTLTAGSRLVALSAALVLGAYVNADGLGHSLWFTVDRPAATPYDLWIRPDGVLEVVTALGVWDVPVSQVAAPKLVALKSTLENDDEQVVLWQTSTQPTVPAPQFGDMWLDPLTAWDPKRWEGEAVGWVVLQAESYESANYLAGTDGWKLFPEGDAQFQDVSAAGLLLGAMNLGATPNLDVRLALRALGFMSPPKLYQLGANYSTTTTDTDPGFGTMTYTGDGTDFSGFSGTHNVCIQIELDVSVGGAVPAGQTIVSLSKNGGAAISPDMRLQFPSASSRNILGRTYWQTCNFIAGAPQDYFEIAARQSAAGNAYTLTTGCRVQLTCWPQLDRFLTA